MEEANSFQDDTTTATAVEENVPFPTLEVILEQMEVSSGPDFPSVGASQELYSYDMDLSIIRQSEAEEPAPVPHSEHHPMTPTREEDVDNVAKSVTVVSSEGDGCLPVDIGSAARDEEAGGSFDRVRGIKGRGRVIKGGRKGKRVQGERKRRKGGSVLPILDWKDFLDSQDILRQYALNEEPREEVVEESVVAMEVEEMAEEQEEEKEEEKQEEEEKEEEKEGEGE